MTNPLFEAALGIKAPWFAADRGNGGGNADNRAAPPFHHPRQERPQHAMDRSDVEIERERPVGLVAVEHRAVLHKARTIDEDVGRTIRLHHLLRERIHSGSRAHIELVSPGRGETVQLAGIEIGRDYRRALGSVGLADGPADPLSRGGDDRDLAVQSIGHCLTRTNRGEVQLDCSDTSVEGSPAFHPKDRSISDFSRRPSRGNQEPKRVAPRVASRRSNGGTRRPDVQNAPRGS
jgi:hypothetical protein